MLNYKSKYPIGIDISSKNIYAIQLRQTRHGFAVREKMHRELDSSAGSTDDMDNSVLSAVKIMAKNRHFRGRSVVLHIPLDSITVFPIQFQVLKKETPEEVIIKEVEKHLSFPVEEAIIDYPSITSGLNGERNRFQATIIAVRRKTVEKYLRLMKQAGFTVKAVDYCVSSLIRLHNHFCKTTHLPVILCNIGAFKSVLTIYNQENIFAQRIIPWGIDLLVRKIIKNFDLLKSEDDVKLILKAHGLSYEDKKNADNNCNDLKDKDMVNIRRAVYQVISPTVDELVYEFHKMISYIRSSQHQLSFEGIYLYGNAALINHLDHYLERRLGMQSKHLNHFSELTLLDKNNFNDIYEYSPFSLALGLAMRKIK